jgi:hypothetical protein
VQMYVCVCARACACVRGRARALGDVRAVRGGLRARARLAWIQDDLNELTQQEIISRARGYTHTHARTAPFPGKGRERPLGPCSRSFPLLCVVLTVAAAGR